MNHPLLNRRVFIRWVPTETRWAYWKVIFVWNDWLRLIGQPNNAGERYTGPTIWVPTDAIEWIEEVPYTRNGEDNP